MVSALETQTQVTEHSIDVAAPPDAVFELIVDVSGWPEVFGPTVHVEVLDEQPAARPDTQVLQIWAFANGQVRTWASRRILDHAARRIDFRQIASASPVATMGGGWRVEPTADGGSRVVLLHDFRAIGDDPESIRLIHQAVDRNSESELAALKTAAELGARRSEVHFTFSDSTRIAGARDDVFAFLDRAELWPQRLPHVSRLDLTEEPGGLQHMVMDTRSPDGSVHTTSSVRVCFPERGLIVYKQLRVPAAMTVHTGRWVLAQDGDEVVATAWHTVTLDPDGVRRLLGDDATLAQARAKVRHALGTNSSTTLAHAKAFAENIAERG